MINRLLRHQRPLFFLVLLRLLLIDCSVFAQNWESPFYRDHSLVGKIWDTGKNTWITKNRLRWELLEYDYILLGETHNNADHHVLQARILNSLVVAGAKPAVVMEMLANEAWQGQPDYWTDIEILTQQAKALNDGWPWELYAPILQSVVQHQLKLVAGNIETKALHEWSNNIRLYMPKEVLTEYWITSQNLTQLKQDIINSHCGHVNAGLVQFMTRVQLHRDQVMASSLVKNRSPVVLIAGAGHVRNDYAVPMQLLRRHKRLSFISVALISVLPGLNNPEDYIDGMSKVYDILYFTPSHTDQDPCVQFRKQLENIQPTNTQ